MYCGSCMHDNTWARGLIDLGETVTLIPTYTPIRVDEKNASQHRVHLGGVNVYLRARSRIWRNLPTWMTRWLDSPRVIRWATAFGVSNDARKLGELTLSMLDSQKGVHRQEYEELARYLAEELKPDIIVFSNALLSGALPAIRTRFPGKILCTLQGDDIFLDQIPDPIRHQVMVKLQERIADFDGFITHSKYYRDFMSKYLGVPETKFHQLSLSIDLGEPDIESVDNLDRPFTVGYFARICPEKGLHRLVDAFRLLKERVPHAKLLAGGYLGTRDSQYFESIQNSVKKWGIDFEYVGSPDRQGKWKFFDRIDVLCVPTEYQEPKGLYVLESLSKGIPVVMPRHGAFPELIEATQGGLLCEPGDPVDLARQLESLAADPIRRRQLGRQGQSLIHSRFTHRALAQQTLQLFQMICSEKSL